MLRRDEGAAPYKDESTRNGTGAAPYKYEHDGGSKPSPMQPPCVIPKDGTSEESRPSTQGLF